MRSLKVEIDRVLSALIHAPSKEGKSTLLSTMPAPGLILDAEGSWKFIDQVGYRSGKPLRKKRWDPLTEPIPRYDGTWDFVLVAVTDWQIMRQTYQWLTQAEHDFESLGLDSITEVQRRCKKNIRSGNDQMDQQRWGQLLDQMDEVIRGFRDLTLKPNPIRCVVLVSETKEKNGQWRPYMQGQIADTMPYWVDVCGYLFTELVADQAGKTQDKMKRLLIGAGIDARYLAGERVQGRLPDIIDNPNFTDIMNTIYPKES